MSQVPAGAVRSGLEPHLKWKTAAFNHKLSCVTIKWQAVTIIGDVVVRQKSPIALGWWIRSGVAMAGAIIVIGDN